MMETIEENKGILLVLALLVVGFFWFGGTTQAPLVDTNGTVIDKPTPTPVVYYGGGGGGVTSVSDDAYQDEEGEWNEGDGTPVTNGTTNETEDPTPTPTPTPVEIVVVSPLNETQFYEDEGNTFVLFEIDTTALNCVIVDSKYDTPLELDENNQHLLEIHNGWNGRHDWNVQCDEGNSSMYWFKINPHAPR